MKKKGKRDPGINNNLSDNRETIRAYQGFFDKAERLFQKEKFGSAKYHYLQANQIRQSEELLEKIRDCEEKADRMSQAQQLLKQGYQLEREKNIPGALKLFQQSLQVWENKEIRILVERLQNKLPKPSMNSACQAEAEHRYLEGIKKYRSILELTEDPQIKDRLGICLVKQKSYAEAAKILESSGAQDSEVCYYAGYAFAKLGQYAKALKHWSMISARPPELDSQKKQLLKTAVVDLSGKSQQEGKFELAYQEALNLLEYDSDSLVRNCVKKMRLQRLEKLWAQEKFEDMLDFLLSIEAQKDNDDFLPFIMAKVYYRLAETRVQYLPQAITFWFTGIYNQKYISPFGSRDQEGRVSNQDRLTADLYQKLEQLFHTYKTGQKDDLPKETLILWETERESIFFLHEMAQKEPLLKDLLCTPAFAHRFGLSSSILEILKGLTSPWGKDERFWEAGVLFSEGYPSFLLLHQGKLEEAPAALPHKTQNIFLDYCRQRIFFHLGMKKLQQGQTNLKKYFISAVPLIKRFGTYEEQIIRAAREAGKDLDKLICIDEILQILLKTYLSKRLQEISSYVMSYKADALYADGVIKAQDVERIYKRALKLYRCNEFAKRGLEEIQSEYYQDELFRAIRKADLRKAANIALDAGDEQVEEMFFDFIEATLEKIGNAPLKREEKLFFLREAYHQCGKIDPGHPVLEDLEIELEELGEKVPE